jgi:hypothetical protein
MCRKSRPAFFLLKTQKYKLATVIVRFLDLSQTVSCTLSYTAWVYHPIRRA